MAPGGSSCCASFCSNFKKKCPYLSFFRFPKELTRCSKWLSFVEREHLTSKTPEDLYKNFYICSEHFEDHCFMNKQKKRLTWNAIPTIKTKQFQQHDMARTELSDAVCNKKVFPLFEMSSSKKMKFDKFTSEEACDKITLIVGEEKRSFATNKTLLSSYSDVFKTMFFGPMAEAKSEIPLPEDNAQIFDIVLIYINTKELRVETVHDAILTYTFADKYLIKCLKEDSAAYLQSNLSVDSILQAYEEVIKLKQPQLRKICWKYISENTSQILKHNSFINTKFQIVYNIISKNVLSVDSELEVYNAVVKWGKENFKETNLQTLREKIFPLLQQVRFLSMTYFEFSGSPCIDGFLTKDEQLEIFKVKSNHTLKRNKNYVLERKWKKKRLFQFLSSCYLSSACKNHLQESHLNFLKIKERLCTHSTKDVKIWGVSFQINVKLCKNNSEELNTNVLLELQIDNLTKETTAYTRVNVSLREYKNFCEVEKVTIILNQPVTVREGDLFEITVCSSSKNTDIEKFIYCTHDPLYEKFNSIDYYDDDYYCYGDDRPHFAAVIASY